MSDPALATDVAFHFGAPDPVGYACRLIRKAVNSGAKLVVTGLPQTLKQLDTDLWALSAVDFVPHCYLESDARVLAGSPVVLAQSIETVPHSQVLLNLGPSVPEGFERFERVIEIVGLDDEDRQWARARWKHYTNLGYSITRHDLAQKASNS